MKKIGFSFVFFLAIIAASFAQQVRDTVKVTPLAASVSNVDALSKVHSMYLVTRDGGGFSLIIIYKGGDIETWLFEHSNAKVENRPGNTVYVNADIRGRGMVSTGLTYTVSSGRFTSETKEYGGGQGQWPVETVTGTADVLGQRFTFTFSWGVGRA